MEIIALALFLGGIVIIIVEKLNIKPTTTNIDDVSKLQSWRIGFCQILAMIPGVSRSGATIIGALIFKLNRKSAAEFSFFLSIPTIFAASIYDFYKNFQNFDSSQLLLLIIGFVTSFFSALIVIKWFINFISNHNFIIFAYYRIILGLALIYFIQ